MPFIGKLETLRARFAATKHCPRERTSVPESSGELFVCHLPLRDLLAPRLKRTQGRIRSRNFVLIYLEASLLLGRQFYQSHASLGVLWTQAHRWLLQCCKSHAKDFDTKFASHFGQRAVLTSPFLAPSFPSIASCFGMIAVERSWSSGEKLLGWDAKHLPWSAWAEGLERLNTAWQVCRGRAERVEACSLYGNNTVIYKVLESREHGSAPWFLRSRLLPWSIAIASVHDIDSTVS